MVPTDWKMSPLARDLFGEAGHRRLADERDVSEADARRATGR